MPVYRTCQLTGHGLIFAAVQEELKEASKDKASQSESGKAEAEALQGSITSLQAQLADQKKKLEESTSNFQVKMKDLESQLHRQKADEDSQKEQLQEASAAKTRLAEVCFTCCCSGVVVLLHQGKPHSLVYWYGSLSLQQVWHEQATNK